MLVDSRLIATTSENLLPSLLNQNRVFVHSFDSASFDGIVFDLRKKFSGLGIPLIRPDQMPGIGQGPGQYPRPLPRND
jgi:hypothetical protein